jgi:hypothetical protein
MKRMYGEKRVCIATLDSMGIMTAYIHPDKLERWPMPYGSSMASPPALAFFDMAQKGWGDELAWWLMGARLAGHGSAVVVLGEVDVPVQWDQHERRVDVIREAWRLPRSA